MTNREENPHKQIPVVADPGDVVSASGPSREAAEVADHNVTTVPSALDSDLVEPAASQIVPWADDFQKECEVKLAEFIAIADKDSPDFPGALADIVDEVREKYEALERLIPYEVRKAMGDHLIGPEAYKKVFGARDLGEIPPIPAHITKELLSEKCQLTTDGPTKNSTIAQTHRLVFIPAKIDGEAFTINHLVGIAEAAGKTLGRDKMFDSAERLKTEPFANTPKEKGEWLLIPMTILPNSRRKNYAEQQAELQKYDGYRVASALEKVTTLVMNDLILRPEREDIGAYYNTYARCTDTSTSGARVEVGAFETDGLDVVDYDVADRAGDLGLAVVRK